MSYLHSLGLDSHHASTLLLRLHMLRNHTLLRGHDLLCQHTQDLVLPLQHLLEHWIVQIDFSEKRKGHESPCASRET